MAEPVKDGVVLTAEQKKRLQGRNIAVGVVLAALVVVFYLVTLVKGVAILNRPV